MVLAWAATAVANDMDVVLVGQRDCLQGFSIGFEARARERFLHLSPCVSQSGYRVAEFVAAVSHPFRVDRVRPSRAECPGLGEPQQEVAYAAPEEHARVENGGFHGNGSAPGSVAEILRFGGERVERAATRRLVPLVGDHRGRWNAMMRADHATGENPLLHEV